MHGRHETQDHVDTEVLLGPEDRTRSSGLMVVAFVGISETGPPTQDNPPASDFCKARPTGVRQASCQVCKHFSVLQVVRRDSETQQKSWV